MTADLKPYPTMKDSGVEWLGMIPEHWEILPNRALFSEVKERDCPDEEMLSVTIKKGVIRQSELLESSSNKDSSNLDRSKYKVVRIGDIAYNKMRAWQGAIGVSDYQGIVSPAYIVQRPLKGVIPRYYHMLFRIPAFAKEAERWSYGIASDMWSLRPEHFKLIYSCLPPIPEQVAIAQYLDYVDVRVRRLTEAKRKLIGLLTEYKQAIIHRAVTRGLDPNVPLKDSGIEWLGMIPQHWELKQLGRIGSFSKGSGGTKEDETTEGVSCIRYGDLYTKYDLLVENVKSYISVDKAVNYTPIQYGDVLFAGSGETIEEIGKSAVNLLRNPVCCAGDVIIFRPSIKLNAKFFGVATGSPYARYQKSRMGRGITIMHIYASELKYLSVALPPLSEQVAIVEYLDRTTAEIDIAVARAERQIELLNEYRMRLIADVVTGKLDVRGAVLTTEEH